MNINALDVLIAGRRIANHAERHGALSTHLVTRETYQHLGAVIADSVLQPGLNYTTVVLPRVRRIIALHPDIQTVRSLIQLAESDKVGLFLNWSHHEKIDRFRRLVYFLGDRDINGIEDLRRMLSISDFQRQILTVRGIGPKTVDYMACLVGVQTIAVDRHVRRFGQLAGIRSDDYDFLRSAFSCAADLLSMSRREFDAWLWQHSASRENPQMPLAI